MVKYYGRARQRVGSVNTNQLGLKMSGCPSKVGRSGRIDRYISRRSHCGIVFCGWVWYHGIKWKHNHWVNPYTKEINWRCIPAAPVTRALAGGVGRLNAPRFRCAKDCGRQPWWNWTNNPHSSPRVGEEAVPARVDGVRAWQSLPSLITQRYITPQQPALAATVTGGTTLGATTTSHTVYVLGGLTTPRFNDGGNSYLPVRTVECYTYPSPPWLHTPCKDISWQGAKWEQYQLGVARVGHAAVYTATTGPYTPPYEVLALGGWGGTAIDPTTPGYHFENYGTLKSVEPFTRNPSSSSTSSSIPDMSEPRCFFGAVCDIKNVNITPVHKTPWWWHAPIVAGGTQLPFVQEWGADTSGNAVDPTLCARGVNHRCGAACGSSCAPLWWSWKLQGAADWIPLSKTAEALIQFGPNEGTWQPLHDLPEGRCAHAMVQTYREQQTGVIGTGPVWVPNVYVIGGCSGKKPSITSQPVDWMYAWPPGACLKLASPNNPASMFCASGSPEGAGVLLKSVVYLELPQIPTDGSNPPTKPDKTLPWNIGPSLNTARGGHNLSAVVFGDYIYVFGGTGTGCPINRATRTTTCSSPCGSGKCCSPAACSSECAWVNKPCQPGECWKWKGWVTGAAGWVNLKYGTPWTGTVTLMRGQVPLTEYQEAGLCLIGNANWNPAADGGGWQMGQDAAVLCGQPAVSQQEASPNAPFGARFGLAAAIFIEPTRGGEPPTAVQLYVMGGKDEEGGVGAGAYSFDPHPEAPPGTPTWTTRGSMLTPRAFFGAAGGALSEILVAGGYTGQYPNYTILASVEILGRGPDFQAWISGAPMNTPRMGHCVVGVSDLGGVQPDGQGLNEVYAIGGASSFDAGTAFLTSVEKYLYAHDVDGWKTLAPMKIGRSHAAATWSCDKGVGDCEGKPYLYVMGGWTGSLGTQVLTNTVERFDIVSATYSPDPNAGKWEDRAPMQTPRAGAVASSYLNNVYIMGGLDKNSNIPGMEVYDCSTNVWSTVNPINKQPLSNMKTPRMYAACPSGANTIDNKIYVAGGLDKNTKFLANMECYDPTTNIWCTVNDFGSCPTP